MKEYFSMAFSVDHDFSIGTVLGRVPFRYHADHNHIDLRASGSNFKMYIIMDAKRWVGPKSLDNILEL